MAGPLITQSTAPSGASHRPRALPYTDFVCLLAAERRLQEAQAALAETEAVRGSLEKLQQDKADLGELNAPSAPWCFVRLQHLWCACGGPFDAEASVPVLLGGRVKLRGLFCACAAPIAVTGKHRSTLRTAAAAYRFTTGAATYWFCKDWTRLNEALCYCSCACTDRSCDHSYLLQKA